MDVDVGRLEVTKSALKAVRLETDIQKSLSLN